MLQNFPFDYPIPALADGVLDGFNNPVQYPGRAKYSLTPVDAPCGTMASGTSIAITTTTGVAIASGSNYVNGGTATVTIGTNSIAYLTAGSIYNLRITSNGRTITFPLSERAGSTVYGYDDLGNTYTGTVTSSDLTAFRAGRQSTYFHGLQYGYRLSGAVLIPANPYTGLACDGSALTNQPLIPNDSAFYQFPASSECIAAYPSAYTGGVPNTYTLAQLQSMGVGARLFHGATNHKTAIYDANQDAASQIKIAKVIK